MIKAVKNRITLNTQLVVFLSAVIMWIALSVTTEQFMTGSNIQNLMNQMAIKGVIGVGVVLVILTGGIDLSIGSLIAVTNVAMALLITKMGLPIPAAIGLTILLSITVGLFNGFLVFDLKLPPFIATLGMMIVLRGVALELSNGQTIAKLPRCLADFSSGSFLYIPNLFWVLIVVVVVIEALLRRTNFGRYTYALGSNPEAARLSGVNTRMVTYGVYILCSLMAGIAGVMMTARTWQGSPNAGTMFELDAIAAAVLGGASLMGAEGNAVGSFIGALLIMTIYNGCNHLGIGSNTEKIIVGAILIITVAVDQYRKKR